MRSIWFLYGDAVVVPVMRFPSSPKTSSASDGVLAQVIARISSTKKKKGQEETRNVPRHVRDFPHLDGRDPVLGVPARPLREHEVEDLGEGRREEVSVRGDVDVVREAREGECLEEREGVVGLGFPDADVAAHRVGGVEDVAGTLNGRSNSVGESRSGLNKI